MHRKKRRGAGGDSTSSVETGAFPTPLQNDNDTGTPSTKSSTTTTHYVNANTNVNTKVTSPSTPPRTKSKSKKPFMFRISPKRLLKKNKNSKNGASSKLNGDGNSSGGGGGGGFRSCYRGDATTVDTTNNNEKKEASLTAQEKLLSPQRGSLFDLEDHKVYAFEKDSPVRAAAGAAGADVNEDNTNDDDTLPVGASSTTMKASKLYGTSSFKKSSKYNEDDLDPMSKFQPLSNVKLKEYSPPASPTLDDEDDRNNSKSIIKNANKSRQSAITSLRTSPDEVHALNKKKRDEYLSQRRNNLPSSSQKKNYNDTNPFNSPTSLSNDSSNNNNNKYISPLSQSTPNSTLLQSIQRQKYRDSIASITTDDNNNHSSNSRTRNISSSPPLLLPSRLESKGSSSVYSFSAASSSNLSLGQDSNSRFSLSSPWSPLDDVVDNDDMISLAEEEEEVKADDENKNKTINDDDDDNKGGNEDDTEVGGDDKTKVDKDGKNGKEENDKKVIQRKKSPFPDDPFAELKDENGIIITKQSKSRDESNGDNNKKEIDLTDDNGDEKEAQQIDKPSSSSNKLKFFSNTQPKNVHVPIFTSLPTQVELIKQHQQHTNYTTTTASSLAHPASIQIKSNSDNASISSSIAESIEHLTNMNILSMTEFLKLDDGQRIQAYRSLAETAAETLNETDEKRAEIFSMGRQVDELSRRVNDLVEMKTKSTQKIKEQRREIQRLKEEKKDDDVGYSGNGSEVEDRVSSLLSELEAKNAIIEALKDTIDKQTSSDNLEKEDRQQDGHQIDKSKSDFVVVGDVENTVSSKDATPKTYESKKPLSERSEVRTDMILSSLKDPHEKTVKERVQDFERIGFVERLQKMKYDSVERDELLGRVKELIIELEAKDCIIDELKVSLEKHTMSMDELFDEMKESTIPANNEKESNQFLVSDTLKSRDGDEKRKEGEFVDNTNESEALQMTIIEKDKVIKELEEKMNGLQFSLQSLNSQPKETPEVDSSVSPLQEQVHDVQTLNTKLSERVQELTANLEEKEEVIRKMSTKFDDTLDEKMDSSSGSTNHQEVHEDEAENDYQTWRSSIFYQQSLEEFQVQLQEKDAVVEQLTQEVNNLKKEDSKKVDFYQNELKTMKDKIVHKKIDELERTLLEKEVLNEKLNEFEGQVAEKDALSERVRELENEHKRKDKLLEKLKDMEVTMADNKKLSESVKQLESDRNDNEKLAKRVKELEVEIGDVSGLLEETFKSVKEAKEISPAPVMDAPNQNGGGLGLPVAPGSRKGALFRLSPKRTTNQQEFTNHEKLQLERICKVHQQTVLRQRKDIDKLQEILNEKDTQLNELRIQATINEEKISVLETQFVELNQSQDKAKSIQSSLTDENKDYIKSLEEKAERDADTIEEMKNQISVLQARSDKLKETIGEEDSLRHEIQDLTTKLRARELIISSLEKSYNEAHHAEVEKTEGGNGEVFAKSLASSEQDSMVNLRKVSIQQELQNAALRRLQAIVQKLDEREFDLGKEIPEKEKQNFENSSKNDFGIITSLTDKLTLLHDYLKVSIHLLETKLSNELESSTLAIPNNNSNSRIANEMNQAIEIRFQNTVEAMEEIKREMQANLMQFKNDVNHQSIQISAKDGVIENLLKCEEILKENADKLQSEVDVFKSLSKYSNVNLGVMTRFQESIKLEQDLKLKDEEIKRLKSKPIVNSSNEFDDLKD